MDFILKKTHDFLREGEGGNPEVSEGKAWERGIADVDRPVFVMEKILSNFVEIGKDCVVAKTGHAQVL